MLLLLNLSLFHLDKVKILGVFFLLLLFVFYADAYECLE